MKAWARANRVELVLAAATALVAVGVGGFDWRAGLIAAGAGAWAMVLALLGVTKGR